MLGLVNRSFQCFVRDMHGPEKWREIAQAAGFNEAAFEALVPYDDALTERVLLAAEAGLQRPRAELLEDLGTYLASHPNFEPARRLLRFGGATYGEFLSSLEELEGRARLAVPDLQMPNVTVVEHSPGTFTLTATFPIAGVGHVLAGLLRAMADDYGALCVIDAIGARDGAEVVSVQLLDAEFAAGRAFDLAARGAT